MVSRTAVGAVVATVAGAGFLLAVGPVFAVAGVITGFGSWSEMTQGRTRSSAHGEAGRESS